MSMAIKKLIAKSNGGSFVLNGIKMDGLRLSRYKEAIV